MNLEELLRKATKRKLEAELVALENFRNFVLNPNKDKTIKIIDIKLPSMKIEEE